jgi:hypothetical protein
MLGGVGSTSVAISGMMTTAPTITTWTRIESGTVYHFCDPELDGRVHDVAEHSRGTGLSS